ncbi:hypothetical protein [Howardella ureilytica]
MSRILEDDRENAILVARRLIEENANLDISSLAAVSGLSEEDIELLIDDINKEKNR